MKETKIAKENIKSKDSNAFISKEVLKEHKQTCQRWLDWMSQYEIPEATHDERVEKITDLKQAIKLYDDAGI